MESLMLTCFWILMGIAITGALAGLADKLLFQERFSKKISEKYDLASYLPVDDISGEVSPFLVIIVIPFLLIFRLVEWPFSLVRKAIVHYTTPVENEKDIDIQKKLSGRR